MRRVPWAVRVTEPGRGSRCQLHVGNFRRNPDGPQGPRERDHQLGGRALPLLCLHIMLLAHGAGPSGLGQPLQEAGDGAASSEDVLAGVCVCVRVPVRYHTFGRVVSSGSPDKGKRGDWPGRVGRGARGSELRGPQGIKACLSGAGGKLRQGQRPRDRRKVVRRQAEQREPLGLAGLFVKNQL